jgi:hypothetical protein
MVFPSPPGNFLCYDPSSIGYATGILIEGLAGCKKYVVLWILYLCFILSAVQTAMKSDLREHLPCPPPPPLPMAFFVG